MMMGAPRNQLLLTLFASVCFAMRAPLAAFAPDLSRGESSP